ncbi:MAG: MaoC family dehydratase [Alphaproteobacteria bacterium]|nr:MaoC family dehydratase [Alphaproteobacteria bacterium]
MSVIKYYWEDFIPGEVATFGAYHVTKEEIIEFASVYDPQLMHTDEEAAKKTFMGGLCASGWHTCAMSMRMMCDHYLLESAAMGSPGLDDNKWRAPVRPGDILSMKRECLDRRVSQSRPEMGLTRLRHTVTNQHGEVKMILEGSLLFARRHPGAEV